MVIERNTRRFETMISFIIILAVMIAFYLWIEKLAAGAEQSKVIYTLSNIRSSIQVFELSMIVSGRQDQLQQHAGKNPITLMSDPIVEYGGEFKANEELADGAWYYNVDTGNLVYKLMNKEGFGKGESLLRYRLHYVVEPGKAPSKGRLKLLQVFDSEK